MPEYPDFPAERATFAQHRDRLLTEHEGEHVVIKGDRILGTTTTLEEALSLGFESTGGPEFFTRRLVAEPEPMVLPAALLWRAE